MNTFSVIEGEGRTTPRRTPDLKIARDTEEGNERVYTGTPKEEVFRDPRDFERSPAGWALLDTLKNMFPQASTAVLGDMLAQAAWELHQQNIPLILSNISRHFLNIVNRAIVEETRSRLHTAALGAVAALEPRVKIPKGWRVYTNEEVPARHETVLIPEVDSNPALSLKRRVERAHKGFLGIHLRGIAMKWGFPSSPAEEVVLEFLTDLWSAPGAFETHSFMEIVELFQNHLDTEFEIVSSSEPDALRPEQIDAMQQRDQREAMIEVMVREGVDYQHAQRLVDQILDQEGPDRMPHQKACKRARNKAHRWLRRQSQAKRTVETRLADEERQGLLRTSELAMHSLIKWLVMTHGFHRDDATHAVWSILAQRQEQDVGNVVAAVVDAVSKKTE